MHVTRIHVLAALSIAALCIAGCLARGAEAKKGATPPTTTTTTGAQGIRGANATPGELSVDGIASLQVIPDVADVSMTLSVEQSRPKRAVSKLRAKQAALLGALQAAGVDRSKLALSTVNLHPVHHPHPRNHEIRGYEAAVTIVVEVRDFDRIAELMETGAEADVQRMSTRFRSTKLPELKKRVRELAFKAARDKAAQIATLMNITVGRVVKVSEGQSGGSWGAVANFNEFVAAPSQDKLMPGAQPLTLTVQVTYEI